MNDDMVIVGAHENNLKNLDIRIPKGKLVVFTGVSGSGKSSLVFDTIAVEAMRELNGMFPPHVRNRLPSYEAPKAELIDQLTAPIVIDQKPFTGGVRSTVGTMTDLSPLLRLLFSRCGQPIAGSSGAYSFNSPDGMCRACGGLGRIVKLDVERVLDTSRSLNDGAILLPGHGVGTYQWMLYANSGLYDPNKPLDEFNEKEWNDLLHGSGVNVTIQSRRGKGIWRSYDLSYEGLVDRIERLYLKRDINSLNKTGQKIAKECTREQVCPSCSGRRLNDAALNSRIRGYNIAEMGDLEIPDLMGVLDGVDDPIGRPVVRKLKLGLKRIADMSLDYLSLNRVASTLSGGESQRLKMVRNLASSLVRLTYFFDEPSAGLHPKDVSQLIHLLFRLRDRGNSVLVVEHDKDVILAADQVVDLGPRAGRFGGTLMFQGAVAELSQQKTLTAEYLRSRKEVKRAPRQATGVLSIKSASLHNLKGFSLEIPKGVMTVVTGVAGSGKSSLVCGELLRQYPDTTHISQAPIGTSSRSTPATYIGIMDDIRRMFAKANGVDAGLFSYNSKGACPACHGKGVVLAEMAFMDPVAVVCEMCRGNRYNDEALTCRLEGQSILDVLNMTVDDAKEFFEASKIVRRLERLAQVGMNYVTLGQPTSTLSGGECQRVKLASHLRSRGGIYALDEPAAGLHGSDIEMLMRLLNQLVDHGNTVVIVEHDLDIVRQADWVVDMGPGGGRRGGRVLFEGIPQELLSCRDSATADYLRRDIQCAR
jgi:excinuclease UvrABC ATPase subunit